MQNKDLEARHFDSLASSYDYELNNFHKAASAKRMGRRVDYFKSLGNINKESKVLELGCGTGELTVRLGVTGAKIKAVDISPNMIMIAKEKVRRDNVEFIVGSADSLLIKAVNKG